MGEQLIGLQNGLVIIGKKLIQSNLPASSTGSESYSGV